MKTFYSLFVILLLTGLFTACASEHQDTTQSTDSELLINMTSDAFEDAHSTYMGLRFAEMGLDQGLEVTIFLNVHGVRLLESEGATLTFDDNNLRAMLDDFTDNGGTVIVCPMCLQIHGMELSSIPSNFEAGEAESMMNRIKTGATVFTY